MMKYNFSIIPVLKKVNYNYVVIWKILEKSQFALTQSSWTTLQENTCLTKGTLQLPYYSTLFFHKDLHSFLTQLTFYCLVINMSAEVATKMLEPHIKKLEDLIQSNPKMDQILIKMEEKTKVKKVYIAIIFMVLVVLWLGSGHAGQLVCNFIGFLYPAYASIKAIGKPIFF